MAKVCSVEDCERPTAARGWCHMHWARWRRNGDPLTIHPKRNAGRAVLDHEDGTRTCNGCDERKPLDDFPKDPNATAGRRSACKVCHTAAETRRYNSDPERFKAKQRRYRLANLDEIRVKEAARYERDKIKRVAYAVEQVHRRRALLATVPFEAGITVVRLRRRHGDRCCYCDIVMDFTPKTGREYRPAKATLEHVIPLSRGGGHTWENVALACWQCNVRKNAKLTSEWTPEVAALLDHPEQLLLWAS